MNHCGFQQNGNFSSFGNGEPVVCPKPRRFHLLNTAAMTDSVRPLRFQMWYGAPDPEPYEFKSGPELLDLMLPHGGGGGGYGGGGYGAPEQTHTPISSSPPFFCGSPPSRVSNPLIQDARFGDDKISPISPRSMIPNPSSGIPTPSTSSSSTSWKGGFLRSSYGNKPSVRIEGFNCLDRDNRRNHSVPALA